MARALREAKRATFMTPSRAWPSRRGRGRAEVEDRLPLADARQDLDGLRRLEADLDRRALRGVAGDDVDGRLALLVLARPPTAAPSARPCARRWRRAPARTCRPSAGAPGSSTRMRVERGVRGRVDGRRDRDDPPGERAGRGRRPTAISDRLARRGRAPRRSAGTLAASSTRSRFATSRSGWAAVPSTCSPTLTRRFTTCPAIGDVTLVARQLPVGGVERRRRLLDARLGRRLLRARVLDFLAGRDAALEQALGAFEVEPRVLERGLRLRDRGRGLPLLVLERPRIDLGHHLAGRNRVALGDLQHHHAARDRAR